MNANLTESEYRHLEFVAEAFAVGHLLKADHALTAALVRKGVLRTSGAYSVLTGFGVEVLRAEGYVGPLPNYRPAANPKKGSLTDPQLQMAPNQSPKDS
jgi:hypothetical protein